MEADGPFYIFNKLSIDIFETKAMRASSYIPTPEKVQ